MEKKVDIDIYHKPEEQEIKKKLTKEQYGVTQKNYIELPFENEYWDNREKGIYVDAHSHLDLFDNRISKGLEIIQSKEILTVACSTDEKSYLFAKNASIINSFIIPCFGIHPWKAHENHTKLDYFEKYIIESPIIGEIGLDFYWIKETEKYSKQRQVLNYFLERAKKYDKITNLHTKGAEEEIYKLIKKYKLKSPIIHWYSGNMRTLVQMFSYGCFFTIGVDIGYSKLTDEIVKYLPIDRILVETDGPTALQWVNGKYGYPDYIFKILEKISILKNLPVEEVKQSIYYNFQKLLNR